MRNEVPEKIIIILFFVFSFCSSLSAQQTIYIRLKQASVLRANAEPVRTFIASGVITKNKEYIVHSTKPGWYQVKTDDGSMGWVPEEFVEVRIEGAVEKPKRKPRKIPEQAGIHINILNNYWSGHWVMSAGPEVTFSGRWFIISADHTFGYYHKRDFLQTTVFTARASFVPMFRQNVGPFFAAAGYGFSYIYTSEKSSAAENRFAGEARALAGIDLVFSSRVNVMFKAGLGFIDKNNLYFSGSMGFLVKP